MGDAPFDAPIYVASTGTHNYASSKEELARTAVTGLENGITAPDTGSVALLAPERVTSFILGCTAPPELPTSFRGGSRW